MTAIVGRQHNPNNASCCRLPRFLPSLHTRLSAAQRRALLLNLGLLYYVAGRPEPARSDLFIDALKSWVLQL